MSATFSPGSERDAAFTSAILNILEDFAAEKTRLAETQKAVLNILEDLDLEKSKVEAANRGLVQEVAERRTAEEALRGSEERLRALYVTMSEGLANHEVVYREGEAVDYIITDVNPAFERITGLTRNEVLGRKASELYGTGSPPYLEIYAKVAAGGSPENFESYFVTSYR